MTIFKTLATFEKCTILNRCLHSVFLDKSIECKMFNSKEIQHKFHVIVECTKYERETNMLMQKVKEE